MTLEQLSWLTNRGLDQTRFLYRLVGNLNNLVALEVQLKKKRVFYCPSSKEMIRRIMSN